MDLHYHIVRRLCAVFTALETYVVVTTDVVWATEASGDQLVAAGGVAFSGWRGYNAGSESHCGEGEDLGEVHDDDGNSDWGTGWMLE